jgi:hypothetical protein
VSIPTGRTRNQDVSMKLYWGPRTCAIGIQILLEEAPTAKLCFNTRATDTADAIERWIALA